jgi:pyruvate dehydrogenase E1 component alpha subunit
MNFAAVFKTPTVFLCQNNQFAISYPRSEQTLAPSIAEKADGYGMPGVEVDGNDVAAVLVAVREAAESARNGEGPALIEAVTYRLGPHTTSDDPDRYRDETEAEEWRERDPLIRIRILLEKAGGWTPEWQQELENRASASIEAAVATAEELPLPTVDEMFERMFAEPTPSLRRQRDEAGT